MSKFGNRCIRIGTRRSRLAKWQTNWVVGELSKRYPELQIEVIEIVTTGDRILDRTLSKVPGKGVFVKEIEDKLLIKEIDLAVHSMKDLPTEFPEGLGLGAVTKRADPRDVLVTRHAQNLNELPQGARIGTSSLRRQMQLLAIRPDFEIVDIRGNIDTRLAKSDTEAYDGIILAAAGLIRMGWDKEIQQFLPFEEMTPAVGQGALGIETRQGEDWIRNLLEPLNEETTRKCVEAERVFLKAMGGGCQTPMGAYCQPWQSGVVFHAFASDDEGLNSQRVRLEGSLGKAKILAQQAVDKLRSVASVAADVG